MKINQNQTIFKAWLGCEVKVACMAGYYKKMTINPWYQQKLYNIINFKAWLCSRHSYKNLVCVHLVFDLDKLDIWEIATECIKIISHKSGWYRWKKVLISYTNTKKKERFCKYYRFGLWIYTTTDSGIRLIFGDGFDVFKVGYFCFQLSFPQYFLIS